jgi:hypothetical protein
MPNNPDCQSVSRRDPNDTYIGLPMLRSAVSSIQLSV